MTELSPVRPVAHPDWQVPQNWYCVPPAHRDDWVERTVADVAPGDPSLRVALTAALGVLSDDPRRLPVVVLGPEAPWLDATGWLDAWPTHDRTGDEIEEFLARESAERESLHSFDRYDIEAADGARCLMLHSFETATEADGALVERIFAFLIEPSAGITTHLSLVTRNLLAFDDLPGLAAEVLDRSTPVPGGAA